MSLMKKTWARIILVVIFGTELLVYSFGLLFYRLIPEPINQFIRFMGTSWMLFLLYAGGIWLLIDMLNILRKKAQRRSWHFKDQSRQYKIITFLAPILIVVGVMAQGHYKFLHPVVQQLPVTIHKQAGNMDSVRIAVVGDLHMGWMINREHTKRFVDLIMAQQPDLILFVGDIIDSQIDPILEQRMDEELARLSAPLGVFSCTGNHEYRYDAEEKIQLLNDVGITMLRDSSVFIDSAFLCGGTRR